MELSLGQRLTCMHKKCNSGTYEMELYSMTNLSVSLVSQYAQ